MITSASDAVKNIKSDDNVFIHSVAAVPRQLINAMTKRHSELRDVNYLPNAYGGSDSVCSSGFASIIYTQTFFCWLKHAKSNCTKAVNIFLRKFTLDKSTY